MDALRIHGGIALKGNAAVSGAKNAALPIMAASLLADGPVCLSRIPRLRDVSTLGAVLRRLGVHVTHGEDSRLRLETFDRTPTRAGYRLVRRMRASFCVLGPLLARRGKAMVALPGGCSIGHRPVDLHLHGLAALGADIRLRRGYVVARASRLQGAEINLSGANGPTVTGTANILCAAVLAGGKTVIQGAALEPEIVDLADFLISLGARISGAGTSMLEIDGVEGLRQAGTDLRDGYPIIADRIETATLMIAAAATGGCLEIHGVVPRAMSAVTEILRTAGATIIAADDRLRIEGPERLRPFHVVAEPYPGIPTDVQPLLLTLACLASGRSTIVDRVFPNRWMHVAELTRMGARTERAGSVAIVDGSFRRGLSGAQVRAGDLRGAAALVLAGLAAAGETVLHRVDHLDRGYERLDLKLAALGARIERIHAPAKSCV